MFGDARARSWWKMRPYVGARWAYTFGTGMSALSMQIRMVVVISITAEIVGGFVGWEWCFNVIVGCSVYLPDLVEHISR